MPSPRFAKFVVFVNCGVPLAMLGWDAYWHQLGANPINFALRTLGMLALVFLMLTLCVTPLRKLTGYNYLSHFRRTLGLYAFFYAFLHLCIYWMFDRAMSLHLLVVDLWQRQFIYIGMASFVLLIPLAITSTNVMIKRLGAKQWKQLHRLTYVAAIGAIVHYYQLVKADVRKPIAFGLVLLVLLGIRVAFAVVNVAKRRALAHKAVPAMSA
jgi:sulfoxide reductase heme-binding subunit YedZ